MEDDDLSPKASKARSFKGFLKTFFWLSGEEWRELDHKLIRIVLGVIGFVAVALFWLFFLRSITPF